MARDDYSSYPPEAKQLATSLFELGMSRNDVITEMRKTYPRINPSTLSSWSINDEAFGVVYRNGIASKAQSVVEDSIEQLEDIYCKVAELLNIDKTLPIEEQLALIKKAEASTGIYRLLMDTARHKKTTAVMLLAKINKYYTDKFTASVELTNKPLVEMVVTKPVADGLAELEAMKHAKN